MPTSVLVVEPHSDLRRLIVEVLTRADCRCEETGNAQDALLRLREGDFTVVLVDSSEDDSPTQALYSAVAASAARLVVIDETAAAHGVPRRSHLQKPFDRKELLDSVVPVRGRTTS
jgi:DNA-binding NtrC family response regulator